ncbi:hypothetical protein SPTER_04590 [Sporomusa termitida]|uniref:Uncharacterized protein n=1 Tax=Sporomusa termitida TaxID=2377 RepID=A0A517DPA3_9FIRM|nr:hypothetical protein SPTER_04590 [Sporomusa termitida]
MPEKLPANTDSDSGRKSAGNTTAAGSRFLPGVRSTTSMSKAKLLLATAREWLLLIVQRLWMH